MTCRLIAFLILCLLLANCKSNSKIGVQKKSESKPKKNILNFKNDGCEVLIKEVSKNNINNFKNSYRKGGHLEMHSDCIPLNKLLCVIMDIDKSDMIFDDKYLENIYYSVIIEQCLFCKSLDSTIKKEIIDALPINIEKKLFNVDSTFILVKDREKLMNYANTTYSDTIVSESEVTIDSLQFENLELEDIFSKLSKEYNKNLIFDSQENVRIDYKLKKSDWNSISKKLETDLGLAFNTKTTQKEKYIVKRKLLIEK